MAFEFELRDSKASGLEPFSLARRTGERKGRFARSFPPLDRNVPSGSSESMGGLEAAFLATFPHHNRSSLTASILYMFTSIPALLGIEKQGPNSALFL